jgi:hypothetical protein
MDLITDLPPSQCYDGNTYDSIVTFVCMLTKQAHFVRANKSITSPQLAHVFLDHVFSKHGLPKLIVSDRDTRITSEFWTTLFKSLGSKLNLSSAHHPQTDGQTENVHRTIEQILRAYVSPLQDDWTKWISVAEFAYNSHVHSSTQASPFYANYGFHPSAPPSLITAPGNAAAAEYLENLRDIQASIARELDLAKARQAEQADRHRRDLSFKIGDRVRLSSDFISLAEYPSSKLRPRYLGPFTIDKIISPVSYRLALPSSMSRVHPVFHVSRLLPWTDNSDLDFPDRPLPDQPIRDARDYVHGDAFLVDRILDCKVDIDPTSRARPKASALLFRVKWSPPWHASEHDSWEPLRNLSKLDALKSFLSSPEWFTFRASDSYKQFARKFPSKVPKVVHFMLDVSG